MPTRTALVEKQGMGGFGGGRRYSVTVPAGVGPKDADRMIANQAGVNVSDLSHCMWKLFEDDTDNNGGTVSSSSSMSLGTMVKMIALGSVVMWGLQFVPSNNNKLAPDNNNEKMEYQQQNNNNTSNPFNNVTTYSEHHIDDSIPEFFNTEVQEEAITDLGQDWDN